MARSSFGLRSLGLALDAEQGEAWLEPLEGDVVTTRPLLAGHREVELLGGHAATDGDVVAVRLVAERTSDAERRRVVGPSPGLGPFRAEAGESQMQHRGPHLLADAAALELEAQPGSAVHGL